jgi:hypothetical protein
MGSRGDVPLTVLEVRPPIVAMLSSHISCPYTNSVNRWVLFVTLRCPSSKSEDYVIPEE